MALPITGGGPNFPGTIADIVANDFTFLPEPYPFDAIDLVFDESVQQLRNAFGQEFAGIIEKGHFIVTSTSVDPTQQQTEADQYITILFDLL